MVMTQSLGKLTAYALVLLLLTGCPEKQTPTETFYNLGTSDDPLMPVGSTMQDPRLAKGSADWVPIRELAQDGNEDEDSAADGAGQTSTGETAEIEEEIRGLLKNYNDLVADRDIDEIVAYHVESQQEAAKAWYETQFAMLDKLAGIESALNAALPDEADRIAAAFAPLKRTSGGLDVGKLTVESKNLVIGELAHGASPMCKFMLIDDEWFIEIPNLPETFAAIKPVLDTQQTLIDNLKQGLESGQIAADQILTQLEAQVKALRGSASQPESNEEGTTGGGNDQPESDDEGQSD